MPEHTEAPLRVALRLVDEGLTRIVFQEQWIAELERDGHDHMLPEARKLLRVLRELQAASETQLARELAQRGGRKAD